MRAPLFAAVAILALALVPSANARVDLTTFWVLPGATIYTFGNCELTPRKAPRAVLAAGLRVEGWIVEDRCGARYARLSLPMQYVGSNAALVAVDKVTTRPPKKDPWADARSTGDAWVRDSGSRWGVPLSDPEWLSRVPLRGGETVEVIDLDRGIVRTSGGHVVAVARGTVTDEDPAIDRDTVRRGESRARWDEGRRAREATWALSGVPAADVLAAHATAWQGRGYLLTFEDDELFDERFDPAWLDPVEQVLRATCHDEPHLIRDGEPCGVYLLDYRALGAWWPDRKVTVMAEADGLAEVDGALVPRLRVLVIQPRKIGGSVGPEWAEGR